MEHPYLFILSASSDRPDRPYLEAQLRARGMSCRFQCEQGRLFIHPDAPVVEISGKGLLIGAVFGNDGTRIRGRINPAASAEWAASAFLQFIWGNYVMIFADHDGLRVMRDPSGSADCVYSLEAGTGFFTSHIGLAVELGLYRREVDWKSIAHGLQFPFLKTAHTGLKGIQELLPGRELHLTGGAIAVRTVWSPWKFVEARTRSADVQSARYRVRRAVSLAVNSLSSLGTRHMVELSGGLDSSIVSACLHRSANRAVFCTLLMSATGTDETTYARAVTDALEESLLTVEVAAEGARFEFPVQPSSVRPSTGILQDASNQIWDHLASAYDVDSFFSGGGGDSIFCYLKTAAPAADAFLEKGISSGILAVRELSSLHQCTFWKAWRLTLRKLKKVARTEWKQDHMLLANECLVGQADLHPWMQGPAHVFPGDREKIHDLIGTQLFREATLRSAARPVHFPLLSQPVMEACLSVPSWMWIAAGRDRAIARDAFADLLPASITKRRSKGSYTGYLAAVYARNKRAMREFLMGGELCAHGLIDFLALEHYFAQTPSARDVTFTRVFELCTAENWVRSQAAMPPHVSHSFRF